MFVKNIVLKLISLLMSSATANACPPARSSDRTPCAGYPLSPGRDSPTIEGCDSQIDFCERALGESNSREVLFDRPTNRRISRIVQ